MPYTERNLANDFEENIEVIKFTTKVIIKINSLCCNAVNMVGKPLITYYSKGKTKQLKIKLY